jgi:uncharacterized protein (DUF1697 family)
MPRFIALLRAINVGGHTVTMERLRRLFEELGFTAVETFIASGNVIFESGVRSGEALEHRIAQHLEKSLGYEVKTFIRSGAELAAVARHQPFPAAELEAEGVSLYVAFLPSPPTAAAARKLMAFRTAGDDFHLHRREVYWLRRGKMSESLFSGALLEKTIGLPATLRNVTTVRKLAAKHPVVR